MTRTLSFAPFSGGTAPVTDRQQVAAIVTAVVRATRAWGLDNGEAAALFDVSAPTWGRMKGGTFKGNLDRDKVTRASLIIGLYKGLRLLFNGPLTYGWPKQPNRGVGFNGRTPVDVMIAGGIPAMVEVRRHIDALRGGA
ncbi:MAG: antitoxin Xre-like helix-turn-helix domain-containing protein [Pseudomonadota bacterium]